MQPTRISRMFDGLRQKGRKGLIAYLTAGDPSPDRTPALVEALVRGGADLIELGVPFSDPIADGPVIQRAGERAIAAGTNLKAVLEIAAEIRRTSEVPLLLFTYLNPVVRYGLDRLARDAARSGIDGCLLTDASVEEAQEYVEAMHRHGLDTVFLAAPTSTPRRLQLVARYSTGFVYLVSRTGVTGERDSVSGQVGPLVGCHARRYTIAAGGRLRHLPARTRGRSRCAGGSCRRRQRHRPHDREEHRQPVARAAAGIVRPRAQARFWSARMTQEEAIRLLEQCRVRIDDVDRRIVGLLNERTRVVEEIGRVKREAKLPIYEPKREEQVFQNVTQSNAGPLTAEALKRVFERMIDEMRTIQRVRMEAQGDR